MPQPEPKNPFYLLLLLAGLAFTVTALAYAVVPTLEQKAIDAGQPPPSPFRDALRADGWKWLLAELVAEYEKPEHGLTVREVAGGYKMATKAEHHDAVRAFVKSLKPALKLSLAVAVQPCGLLRASNVAFDSQTSLAL